MMRNNSRANAAKNINFDKRNRLKRIEGCDTKRPNEGSNTR